MLCEARLSDISSLLVMTWSQLLTAGLLTPQAAISLFAISQLILVVLWATEFTSGALRSVSIASTSLSFVVSLIACALSYTEHSKSLSPSLILNAYLFVSLVLDGATLRTTWLSPLPASIRALITTSFTLKAAILILEAKEKREYILNVDHQHSPEDTSGLYSRGLFWWLNPLLLEGFHHLLKPSDLFPVADGMSAAVINERFWNNWDRGWFLFIW
jgi:ATP-binding cassette subfamily C (CFTR/MRP) protein 1